MPQQRVKSQLALDSEVPAGDQVHLNAFVTVVTVRKEQINLGVSGETFHETVR